jgi:ADP-ribose pyrophosphatase YjhB (NUDIX family)
MTMSPYVRRLRALVGHDLLLLPSVTVVPRDDRGQVLLVRRADDGQWAAIGGMLEPGERPEDAARRETLEEAGVEVVLRGILVVVGGPGYEITYPNGDVVAYMSAVYLADVRRGTPRGDGHETTDAAWFTLDELDTLDLGASSRQMFTDARHLLDGS